MTCAHRSADDGGSCSHELVGTYAATLAVVIRLAVCKACVANAGRGMGPPSSDEASAARRDCERGRERGREREQGETIMEGRTGELEPEHSPRTDRKRGS